MLGDDPPSLSVGTEVSAKYKGAFCEAKIRKVVRSVKCRVTYKQQGLGTATVADDQIRGTLRVGASVEVKHVDRKELVEATITKIQDCSQYTVVFDDGDITTLRRTALCLKSGRHFAESETLDQLPLTHPEHFGNPVIGGRRGRRSRQAQDESSEDEDSPPRGARDSASSGGAKEGMETEPEIGRVVCVELGDKKKKDNWFPGLVVAPTAQDTVRIRVRDDYLVRSFKDARYYTVPKKEATEFTKELVNKVENSTLKVAVEKALLFLEKNELPPHWDRDSLFGHSVSSGNSDYDGELDSDSSDDEPREEKDHFVAQLYKFMDDRGTPINVCPMIGSEDIDLYRLFRAVYKLGGYNRVTNQNQWKAVTRRLGFSMQNSAPLYNLVKQAYKKVLHSFEDFYRKLGCTMVNHPRGSTRKQRPGRSLIRDKDRNTPVPPPAPAQVKSDKDEDEKKAVEDEKKEKKELKKEQVKEEEVVKVKKKEESEGNGSGQESDVNVEGDAESSSNNEKSQKLIAQISTLSPTSCGTATTSSSRTKSKGKEDTKKKVTEKKKTENKKQEKKDEKVKEEEATKTRSKAKDDTVRNKGTSESRETRTPSREADKKTVSKQRRLTDEELKKRGRKRKEHETEKSRADEQLTEIAPSYKGPVECGDKLKVYYGPTHESKVTYEAKVIEIEKEGPEPMYLVHYTGWNTRYDEWIKASRIAQNITQAQGKVKRIKATPRPQTPSTNSSNNKLKSACNSNTNVSQSRRRAQSVAPTSSGAIQSASTSTNEAKKVEKEKDKEMIQPTRSTTPLSIASSSSRTKSPATPANRPTRTTRSADLSGVEHRRRTRRTSGHTDISVASESEDSEGYESDTMESEQTRTRLRGMEERKRKEARRAEERIRTDDVTVSDAEDDKDNSDEPRKGRRLRRMPGKSQGIKSEPDSDQDDQPKGRDFDLNQIRSELKGFDKAVKMEIVRMEPEDEVKPDDKENAITASPKLEKTIELPKMEVVETKVESTEDIYEFKEPEPFEFEVRNKRDTSSDKDKLKKRVFEDEVKSPKKKQKTLIVGSATKETKLEPSETDSRKKPRKLFGKRSDDAHEATTAAASKPLQATSCEDIFNKMCEPSSASSFNQLKSTVAEESGNKVAGINLLFNDLPADDEGMRDDSEDRLIISETEISETEQENAFAYQQEIPFQTSKSDTAESSKNEAVVTVESVKEETSIINTGGNNKPANIPDQKQNQVKSLSSQVASSGQSQPELKMLDTKLLDIVPIPSPIVTPPAPISARLPATSTIEEKLSAAMAFRSKVKDTKKTVDEEVPDSRVIKAMKEGFKKLDSAFLQRSGKDADCITSATEVDKKQEKIVNEENIRREIMRGMVSKRKEEELSKSKKEAELKKFTEAIAEHKAKYQDATRDEGWKSTGYEMSGDKKLEEEYKTMDQKERDRIESRKKQINQDIDSTDSSDSEQRLVIDNEELQDVKASITTFDVKLQAELGHAIENTQEKYGKSQVLKISQNSHQQQQQEQEFKADNAILAPKTDEEGETMNSLLCEEEIPGSPAPLSESIEQASVGPLCSPPKNEAAEDGMVLMEMPFASAPTSGQSTSSSSTTSVATLSTALPKTVETSKLISLPTQQNTSSNMPHQRQPHQQLHHHHHQQQQQQHVSGLISTQRRESNEAAPVMDNTPPTTPDSSISNISGSPREERTGGSSPISEENIKLNRDNSEADNDSAGKGLGFSEDDILPHSEGSSADRILKPPAKRAVEDMQSPKKRKRNRKHSECGSSGGVNVDVGVGASLGLGVGIDVGVGVGVDVDVNMGVSIGVGGTSGGGVNNSSNSVGNSGNVSSNATGSVGGIVPKKPGRQNGRHGKYGAGSDSDDTSEGSNLCGVNNTPPSHAISTITNVSDLSTYSSSRSPRPTKYNFYVELDPELDGSQRIAVLQQKLTELRKTYNAVKVELAGIERRRKKLRRREREAMKAAKAEMQQACS
ncbi:AT-rich interactive domain-containing protein 4B [Monomorium pharaonis]|uniref:AT-rich interactive domain-containing protein 4B n=1 Tax=Monomorium pharaonis TaxID=307658 RepID=UPI0017468A36|nr:AT-rich interactive domain-containing protein 4B [Monomorium pharaonis]